MLIGYSWLFNAVTENAYDWSLARRMWMVSGLKAQQPAFLQGDDGELLSVYEPESWFLWSV